MAGAIPKQRPHHSVYTEGSTSTTDALKLHNLIDLTCGKINELKKLVAEECDILGADFSDDFMEPVLQRQDLVIQRAMRCIQAQQKAVIQSTEPYFGARKNDRRSMSTRSVAMCGIENQKSSTMDLKAQKSGYSDQMEPVNVNPLKEKKKWRLGMSSFGKDKRKDSLPPNIASTRNELDPNATAPFVSTDTGEGKVFENNSSWYGSLDRNVVKKKKRSGLDKSRRHTKTVGSMAGLDFVERCEELRPDEQYEIGLPCVSNINSRPGQLVSSYPSNKHRPPLPSPYYQPENQGPSPPPRPLSKKDLMLLGSNINKEPTINMISPIDRTFSSNLSLTNPSGFNKSSTSVLMSSDPFRISNMTKNNTLSSKSLKSWYETNLDDGNLSSQSLLSLSSRSVLDPSSSLSFSGLDSTDGAVSRLYIASPGTDISEKSSKSSESSETRCSFTNESSKPFEMSDYYKYSTKFRSQASASPLVPQENMASISGTKISLNSYLDANPSNSGRIVAVNVNDELRFTSINDISAETVDDPNGNSILPPVPKLPPKQHGRQTAKPYQNPVNYVSDHLANGEDVVDDNNMAWVLDTDPPTFV